MCRPTLQWPGHEVAVTLASRLRRDLLMIARLLSSNTHLDRTSTADRERRVTPGSTTLLTALLALVVGCGGGASHKDAYARGTQVQESCCEHLAGPGRDSCLQQIVRITDLTVAGSSVNQSTFACVVDHFSCDATSGHATKDSAQAQLECIQDLQVSSR
jgi:hypothetical protein